MGYTGGRLCEYDLSGHGSREKYRENLGEVIHDIIYIDYYGNDKRFDCAL